MRRRVRRLLLALSGLIPLLALLGSPPDPVLLIYSLFILALFIRPQDSSDARPYSRPDLIKFGLATIAFGLFVECLAWLSNYLRCNPEPALLHPQLLPDLILGVGFYGVWSVAWPILFRFFRFTLGQVFLSQGIFGVLIEQQGAIFLQGLATLPLGLLLWLYVFLVYGSITGLAYLLTLGAPNPQVRRDRWWKYPLSLLLIALLIIPISGTWNLIVGGLRLIPEPQSICERPLL